MRIALNSHQVEYDPVPFGQLANQTEQFRFRQHRYGIGIDRRIGQLFKTRIFMVKTLLLIGSQRGIDHNASDPALERALKLKLVQLGKDFQKTFLENIGRICLGTRITQANHVHLACKTLVQDTLTLR